MGPLTAVPAGSPVQYPEVKIGGKTYQLRLTHSAWFQIRSWGYAVGDPNAPVPIEVYAAAGLGTVDAQGNFRTVGFVRPLDMLDLMSMDERMDSLIEPVLEALKKVLPEADLTLVQPPAPSNPEN